MHLSNTRSDVTKDEIVQSDFRSSYKSVGILYEKYPNTYVIDHKYFKSLQAENRARSVGAFYKDKK